MTSSHGHQRRALLDGLLKRARAKLPSLSMKSMELAYDFDDQEQLKHALDHLVETKHLSFDIEGRFPAIRILKGKMNALQPLARPLFLSPAKDSGTTDAPDVAYENTAKVREAMAIIVATTPLPANESPAEIADELVEGIEQPKAIPQPDPVPPPTVVASTSRRVIGLPKLQAAPRKQSISFQIAPTDYEWMLDQLDRMDRAVSLSSLARDMFIAELDRQRTARNSKPHIAAGVIRAAREEGVDLGVFVTRMIAVGMAARQHNRSGL